jgi:hypothetical protein
VLFAVALSLSIMGSYISVLNDTTIPVTVWFRSHGGAAPATPDGEHRMLLAPDQENKAGFNLSYAIVIYCEWKEPGSETTMRSQSNFSPPTDQAVTNVKVSQIIGSHLPALKVDEKKVLGWVPVHTIRNASNTVSPSVSFKVHVSRFVFFSAICALTLCPPHIATFST